jgi:hypothetical protein
MSRPICSPTMSNATEVVPPVRRLVEPVVDEGFDDFDNDEYNEVDYLPPSEHGLAELLESWNDEDRQGDPEEQRRSWELLKHLLDEDRLGYRPLFPK